MSQVSSTLRRTVCGFAHWCPGCGEIHQLPDSWAFDGNLESPTFAPSFKHDGIQRVFSNGRWTGEWVRYTKGNTVPYVCHYVLTAGILNFCPDSTHSLAGKAIALPPLPEGSVEY